MYDNMNTLQLRPIEKLPKFEREEGSLYGSLAQSRSEAAVVYENVFVYNDRERQLYCQQESDLRVLNDWIRREDDVELADIDKPWPIKNAKLQVSTQLPDASNLKNDKPLTDDSIMSFSRQKAYDYHFEREEDQKATQLSHYGKEQSTKKLPHGDTIGLEVLPQENLPFQIRQTQPKTKSWLFPKHMSEEQSVSFLRKRKRLFQKGEFKTYSTYRKAHLTEAEDKEISCFPQSTQEVKRNCIINIGKAAEDRRINALLQHNLRDKQIETALSKLCQLQDTAQRVIHKLCRMSLQQFCDVAETELPNARQKLLNLCCEMDKAQQHVKYSHIHMVAKSIRQLQHTLTMLTVVQKGKYEASSRSQHLESILQDFISCNSFQKIVKKVATQRFLKENRDNLRYLEQKMVQAEIPIEPRAVYQFRKGLEEDCLQIQQCLTMIPSLQSLQDEAGKLQTLEAVRTKLKENKYRPLFRDEIVRHMLKNSIRP